MARALPLQERRLRAGDEDGVPGRNARLNVSLWGHKAARESRDQLMPPGRLHRPAPEPGPRFWLTFPS